MRTSTLQARDDEAVAAVDPRTDRCRPREGFPGELGLYTLLLR